MDRIVNICGDMLIIAFTILVLLVIGLLAIGMVQLLLSGGAC